MCSILIITISEYAHVNHINYYIHKNHAQHRFLAVLLGFKRLADLFYFPEDNSWYQSLLKSPVDEAEVALALAHFEGLLLHLLKLG